MGSARGGRRPGRRGSNENNDGGDDAQAAAPVEAASPAQILSMVAANPVLQGAHVVQRSLIQQGLDQMDQLPQVRKLATAGLADMLQGTGPNFSLLNGAPSTRINRVPAPPPGGARACGVARRQPLRRRCCVPPATPIAPPMPAAHACLCLSCVR